MIPRSQILEPLPDAEQMRAIDRWAIDELGIPSLDLMERAGDGLARITAAVESRGRVVVVCGAGNNGGDGLVAARLLHEAGREVRVLLAGDEAKLSADAAANRERLPVALEPWDRAALDEADVAIDALLGTGFAGELRPGPVRDAIVALADAGVPVVAADVPSGIDAATGEVAGPAVHARATATFHAHKPGLWIAPGKQHAGAVHVVDIGIPDGAPVAPATALVVAGATWPRSRGAASTKFSSGHVLVCGGSTGLTGAPCLAAEAAMRAGAGYVTACVPASLNLVFESRLLEVMTRPLPDDGGALTVAGLDAVLAEAKRRGGALVLGPGLGRTEGATTLARELARRAPVSLVLDADGLNAHAGRPEDLAERACATVLTPHAGELGRLLEVDADAVAARRLHHAREAARRARSIVVLKGDDTLVAAPDGRVGVSRGDAPALATAGTGDVLSGVVAALLATIRNPRNAFEAACVAVELHRRAGRRAARDLDGPDGVIASDVIAALPRVRDVD